ncbi:hypothetical protein ACQ1ZE_15135, partial [Enterococcus faecalis]|uniref:hypothetical protein n=1 Tax=Enterococcus faecalis TaxID=1351 RepID=UPI003D6A6A3C
TIFIILFTSFCFNFLKIQTKSNFLSLIFLFFKKNHLFDSQKNIVVLFDSKKKIFVGFTQN